jgi:hypothetical protein
LLLALRFVTNRGFLKKGGTVLLLFRVWDLGSF